MKNVLLLSLGMLIVTSAYAAGKEITATVNGMVCGFCAQGIKKKFSAEAAVEKVDVSLEKKTVKIDLKDGQDLDDKRVEELLKEAGYNVGKISRNK